MPVGGIDCCRRRQLASSANLDSSNEAAQTCIDNRIFGLKTGRCRTSRHRSSPDVSLQLLNQELLFLYHLTHHIADGNHTNQLAMIQNR